MDKEEKEEKREECASLRYSGDVSADELREAEEYLSSYRHGVRMLDCMRYGRQFMGSEVLPEDPLLYWSETYEEKESDSDGADETIIRARMYGVRQFISELKCDSNTRILLYWHYIRGVSVTRCAEMMDMSRAGAFRVRKRALECAAKALRKVKKLSSISDLLPL
ncbi:MAG: hypothetical protein J6S71_10325 [Clostridia bacterium]|nr:hypothetical protein [Clostridia bacterium]